MKALPQQAAWNLTALLSLAWCFGCGSADKSQHDADAPLVASSDCRTRAERCNALDDDCDGIIDEQADSRCGLAHAAASCVRGNCVIDHCSQDYFNCNGIMSDGCEAKSACGSVQPAAPGESMASSPDMPSVSLDASTPSVTSPESPPSQQPGSMDPDEVDGGEVPNTDMSIDMPEPDADAGASCEAERCDGQDNDCDRKVDESSACDCEAAAPSGQGPECDRCLCNACPEELAACTGTDDEEWNMLCGDVLACFGRSVQAGQCAGTDSDCFQNGDGPCASEFRAAFARGWICTAEPVRTPCGALTRVRLECFRNQCAAVCKA
jgi:hypothetical protein